MVDHISRERRSWLMSRVQSKNTAPEMRLRRALFAAGLRYRLHYSKLQGKPDVVLPGRRLAIFVHGCFWHRHPACPKASNPKSRAEFWNKKFDRNQERDAAIRRNIEQAGWNVLVVWECETKDEQQLTKIVDYIRNRPTRGRGTDVSR
jgi:DNA mismatch endonuclease (patch repair protein)